MVSYTITIRGGATHTPIQHIEGTQDIHCRHAVLTSVVVQLDNTNNTMHGFSVKFPSAVCPPSATHNAGPDNEASTQNRVAVHFSQDTGTFFYKPNLIMHDMTFLSSFEVQLYDIMNTDTLVTQAQLNHIHCITLHFSCAVDSLIMA